LIHISQNEGFAQRHPLSLLFSALTLSKLLKQINAFLLECSQFFLHNHQQPKYDSLGSWILITHCIHCWWRFHYSSLCWSSLLPWNFLRTRPSFRCTTSSCQNSYPLFNHQRITTPPHLPYKSIFPTMRNLFSLSRPLELFPWSHHWQLFSWPSPQITHICQNISQ
jgi:hypothetical protein